MSKLHDIARAAVGNGGLTSGLQKIKLDDLIARYPEGVSITGVDIINYEGSRFPSFTFAEDDTLCFSGGMALIQMADAWLEGYEGDIQAINEDLMREPVRIQLEKVMTKSKRTYTRVKILPSKPEPAYNPETGEVIDDKPAPVQNPDDSESRDDEAEPF